MKEINEQLGKLSGKKHIILTPSGDKAIEAAFSLIKGKKVIVPDQGAWFSYKKIPLKYNYEIEEVKTNLGIIDTEDLKKKSEDADTIIYQQPGGYFAFQKIEEIFNVCKEKKIILDITGCIGTDKYNSKFCDMVVCSFGKWKPIEAGYGGFLAFDDDSLLEEAKKFEEFDNQYENKVSEQIKSLKEKYDFYSRISTKVKRDLYDLDIIHPTHNGINVIVRFYNEEEKERIINYCKQNELEFTLCPRYIRVMTDAISIEIKRLKVK
ncbi:DegT/DnrJ/EryC1/StrS family aminotransferase [Nanoarchaeota archaeon]